MILYNEIEPFAVEWIRKLEAAGKIPKGKIDDRSIKDINPADIAGVRQFHTFAGIAGWPLALRIARWPENLEVWTGSCPCQPFSVAGNGEGEEDPRHLWPDWLRLITARAAAGKPVPTIFGEQVASEAGKRWFADVRTDLEALGYEVGGPICALRARALNTSDKEFISWPTPGCRNLGGATGSYRRLKLLRDRQVITEEERRALAGGSRMNPDLSRWLMGFPVGWH